MKKKKEIKTIVEHSDDDDAKSFESNDNSVCCDTVWAGTMHRIASWPTKWTSEIIVWTYSKPKWSDRKSWSVMFGHKSMTNYYWVSLFKSIAAAAYSSSPRHLLITSLVHFDKILIQCSTTINLIYRQLTVNRSNCNPGNWQIEENWAASSTTTAGVTNVEMDQNFEKIAYHAN